MTEEKVYPTPPNPGMSFRARLPGFPEPVSVKLIERIYRGGEYKWIVRSAHSEHIINEKDMPN